jgi:hypothetical protein
MKKYIIIAVIVLIIIFLIFFVGGKIGAIPESINPEQAYQEKNYQAASSFDREIVVYGKVIDGKTNEPLENVALEVVYPHASMMPPFFKGSSKKIIKTDKNGLFLVSKIYGDGLALRGITKEGYWARNQFYSFPQVDVVTYKPDKDNPLIFKMYKEVKDNYLLNWDAGNNASSMKVYDGKTKSCFYSIKNYGDSYENLTEYNRKIDYLSFDFQATLEKQGKNTTIAFKDSDGQCSFFFSEKDFLEENDLLKFTKELKIEKELEFKGERENKLKTFYVYFHFGKLGLYARAETEISFTQEYSRIKFKFLINPYGEYLFETFDINKLDDTTQIAIWKNTEIKLKEGILPTRAELRQLLKLKEMEPPKPSPEEIAMARHKKWLAEVKENQQNQEIKFYGKVVDNKGKVIPEAVVAYQWFYCNDQNAISLESSKLRADKNGVFEINNCWGYQLQINDIFKFEYFRNRVIRGNFNYFYIIDSNLNYQADKNKPVIFQLNNEIDGGKLNNRRELTRFERSIKASEEKDLRFNLKHREYQGDDEFDFKIQLKQGDFDLVINLIFQPDSANFIISDKEDLASFTQAATSQSSIKLSLPKEEKNYQEVEKYLLIHFLKSNYYAKIQLRLLLNKKECQFQIHSLIDIFGKKNFDSFNDVKYTGADKHGHHEFEPKDKHGHHEFEPI